MSVAVGGEFLVFEGQRREVAVEHEPTERHGVGRHRVCRHALAAATRRPASCRGCTRRATRSSAAFSTSWTTWPARWRSNSTKCIRRAKGLVGFQTADERRNRSTTRTRRWTRPVWRLRPSAARSMCWFTAKTTISRARTRFCIDLNGLDEDTSLDESGAAARRDRRHLGERDVDRAACRLSADSTDIEFAFAGDTSGVLAALGLNTFFTGSTAATIGVNDEVEGHRQRGQICRQPGRHRRGLAERGAAGGVFGSAARRRPAMPRSPTCTTN